MVQQMSVEGISVVENPPSLRPEVVDDLGSAAQSQAYSAATISIIMRYTHLCISHTWNITKPTVLNTLENIRSDGLVDESFPPR